MGTLKERRGMDQPGLRHESLIGTREHIGTANSYLSVYNTHFFIYLIFVHEIYDVIGFFVFLVFQPLIIKDFSEQVRPVGFSSEILQAAFLCRNGGG